MTYLDEIKISNSANEIEVKNVKADFIGVKASESYNINNYNFDSKAQEVLNNDKKLIVYHLIDGKTSGAEEAFYFWKIAHKYSEEAIFVTNYTGNVDISYIKAFLDNFYKVSNKRCVVSMSENSYNISKWKEIEKDYKVWIEDDQGIFNKNYFYGSKKSSEIKKVAIKQDVGTKIETTSKEKKYKRKNVKSKKSNQYKKTTKK